MGKIVTKTTKGTLAGGFIYSREKKVFDKTTLEWLRAPGEIAASNATREVLRELNDLSVRFDRLHEFLFWKMMSGTLSYTRDNTIHVVDYLVSASHKPTASVFWNDPASDPVANIRAWKQLIARDGHAVATDVYANSTTMQVVIDNAKLKSMMSDAQKQQYVQENRISRLLGLNWTEYDLGYVDDFTDPSDPTFTPYIPDGYLVIVSRQDTPWVMLLGPSADDDAPEGFTGRFTKSWKEPDPSSRQVLMEQNVMPVLLRPEQIIYARIF